MVDSVISYSREMGLTHSDFWRLLPRAMGEHSFVRKGDEVHATVHDGRLVISLGSARERRIAMLHLPYSEVTFTFSGVNKEQQMAFKKHFDQHFQRGGG
ncbi:MAG: hypothetical protein AB8B63_17355 [Granulosicoccus sp.]